MAAFLPSQGAIPAMTRSLAVEFAARNPRVRVNCVRFNGALSAAGAPHAGMHDHVAHAVLFLLENDFITGVCLPVDGVRTSGPPVA